MLNPSETVAPWDAEAAADRIENCRKMLLYHGFLTKAENELVKKRIRKWAPVIQRPSPKQRKRKAAGK